eukprot:CAMPEP_0172870392 /NCGR_PEP_ID=MMETSP1075-20121228/91496_1 /TAXON_ID=2916 /ORGANISM="Ceratium fusus, Strain PA161109" /LENGTH=61 /DNA_ID=CAMNT_0013720525 /DNA_START=525 /DNA_END=710 /DNA_ORIENTATION=+
MPAPAQWTPVATKSALVVSDIGTAVMQQVRSKPTGGTNVRSVSQEIFNKVIWSSPTYVLRR